MSIDTQIAEVMKQIFAEIPAKLNIQAIMHDAFRRMSEAMSVPQTAGEQQAGSLILNEKLVEVLREIAAYAVEQFEKRTGQQFLWTEPEETEPEDILMSFSLDAKGNVVIE